MQNKIEKRINLFSKKGVLSQKGYGFFDCFNYNREQVKQKSRLKEWEFYQVSNSEFLLQITYGHVSYMTNVSFTLLEFATNVRHNVSVMLPLTYGRTKLNFSADEEHTIDYRNKNVRLSIKNEKEKRYVSFSSFGEQKVNVKLTLSNKGDAMCIATPFDKCGEFYCNYKKCFEITSSKITVGEKNFNVTKDTLALVDSGRGVWPYKHSWVWGCGGGLLGGGDVLCYNFGYGFGDTCCATENMLFLNGQGEKLEHVLCDMDTTDYTKRYAVTDKKGSVNLIFTPAYDNFTQTKLLFVNNQCHQVFGRFDGSVVVKGEKREVKDMWGFIEHAQNQW